MSYSFMAKLWRWTGDAPASWVFATLPPDMAFAIRLETQENRKAFGSVRVTARIGESEWQTSLFPDKASGGYLLPVKASVRKAEDLHDGSEVEVRVRLVSGDGSGL